MASLFEGTNLGLIVAPGQYALQAAQAAAPLGAAASRGVEAGMRQALEKKKMAVEEERVAAVRDAGVAFFKEIRDAASYPDKMNVLQSPQAQLLLSDPDGRQLWSAGLRMITTDYTMQRNVRNTAMAMDLENFETEMRQLGVDQESFVAGPGNAIYDAGAEKHRVDRAETLGRLYGVPPDKIDLANLPTLANGRLWESKFINTITPHATRLPTSQTVYTGGKTATTWGTTTETDKLTAAQRNAQAWREYDNLARQARAAGEEDTAKQYDVMADMMKNVSMEQLNPEQRILFQKELEAVLSDPYSTTTEKQNGIQAVARKWRVQLPGTELENPEDPLNFLDVQFPELVPP